ncbi:hypothetical protein ED733_002844 [Metarhizium rileyi]|uniref:Phosphatidyl synthase n=1 Tax=Metarhizium rileyi (strain RCEF 4871) TaxID=1649241 RepID=A0A5C6G878_METRR|nr:hypothetical protein ED733_002844 [Metarhizium rileyi]
MLTAMLLSRATRRACCKRPPSIALGITSTCSPTILLQVPQGSRVISSPAYVHVAFRTAKSQDRVRYLSFRPSQSQPQKFQTDHPKAKPREKTGSSTAGTPLSTDRATREDIYTVPNFLTVTRLIAAPVVGYLILHESYAWAVGLFAYAGITDLLDGWIARKWNCKTVVGTVIDPMADKALMTILTICLAAKGTLPLWVATIILGRDVGLGIAAIYYRWVSLPPPKTFFRYWDFSLPSAEVRPTTISKYNTFLQLGLVGLTTAAPLFDSDLTAVLMTLQYVVAATTLWSGASYLFSKDAVKIL